MIKEIRRCMGCMNEKDYSGPCKICGYIDNNAYPADCLAPGTYLNERYIIGKLISKNGEGCVYLAYDEAEERAAEIREYLPDSLCHRAADGVTVEVNDGSLPLFKSYLSEFADLHKTVITSMQKSSLVREYDIFSSGNTGYVVTEHPDGMALEDWLNSNGNVIRWDEISEQLKVVLATLDILHEKGIVHRGISPSTMFVASDGRLLLTSISISAARTTASQINCEMFPGYSAYEQYELSERQGAWTDIYALCAVLYFALTGEIPPEAPSRKENDTLRSPAEINPEIPHNVSEAIYKGMMVNHAERIHSIESLTRMIYFDDSSDYTEPEKDTENDGPIVPKVSVKLEPEHISREKKRAVPTKADIQKKKAKKKKMSNIGTLIGIIVFFSLVAGLIIAILYFADEAQQAAAAARTSVTTTTPTETETEKVTTARTTAEKVTTPDAPAADILLLPDFVNRFFNPQLESRYSMLTFEAEYDYSDEYAEGIIYEQDIEAGTQVVSGTVIKIKVSKGAAYTYLPDYIGMKLSEYTNKLVQLGVRYEAIPEESTEVKAGYVVRCSREIGEKVYISQNEIVEVYYAVTPKETTPPETEPPAEPGDNDEIEEEIAGENEE